MARFVRGKTIETTDGFPTIPVPKSVETMATFGKRKKFETTGGFPTIPVQKSVETMADLEEQEISLQQRMDFQQSQCKKALKLWR